MEERLGGDRHGNVERVADFGSEEIRSCDADDRKRNSLDVEALPDDVGGATIPALPERVADDRDRPVRPSAPPIIRFGERPTENCGDAECVEDARAGPDPVHELRFATRGEVEP